MMVVELWMWPKGDRSRRYFLGAAAADLQGMAAEDDPEIGLKKGERWYRIRALKMPRFGGPGPDELEEALHGDLPRRQLWRQAIVRGHTPTARGRAQRGPWDLIGGALKVMLGDRLDRYQRGAP